VKLKRYAGNPILSPNQANEWESLATTNPGAWYDEASGKVVLLYRAAGPDPQHRIYFGLATSCDGYHFERAADRPVFGPSADGFDAGCVEDPRIIKLGEYYYITYAARAYPPGQYWLAEGNRAYRPPDFPAEFPRVLRQNDTSTGLAITKDFRTYIRAGRITDPMVDDRDVILFPEKVGGRFAMLHRPMTWVGTAYGAEFPAMWISFGDDLLSFKDARLLATAKYPWEHKIGGNTPPIRTPYGWLTLYHAVGPDMHYRLGALLLDLQDPSCILNRTPDWLIQPEEWYEIEGYYRGVIFPCGSIVRDDTLFVYYGGADKYVGLATCSLSELIAYLRTCPG